MKKKKRRAARHNPAPVPQSEIAEAVRRFTGFRGDRPGRAVTVSVPALPRVLLTVGECLGIMYRTRRDGKVENYLHRFSRRRARPTLAASSDGRLLVLLGGEYRFTDRGIEDAA
jgi:hypothetical protein